jgi:hypothetical protein
MSSSTILRSKGRSAFPLTSRAWEAVLGSPALRSTGDTSIPVSSVSNPVSSAPNPRIFHSLNSLHRDIRHDSSCSCDRCRRCIPAPTTTATGGRRPFSFSSAALQEQSAGLETDTSFIHPTETNTNYTESGGSYWLMQPVYDASYLEMVKPSHRKPASAMDWTGFSAVWIMRRTFDLITGYGDNMTHSKWMTRFLFLESVAGVPGMVGAMHRHLKSLRAMRRDGGRIHTLLEESENERMHLLTFLQLKDPGALFRFNVIATQGIFMTLYTLFYALSPKHCHAFVSYLEEEAVKTYTHAIRDYDEKKIPEWASLEAPAIAKKYWRLGENATFRDLLLNVRADEACHQHVNAAFAEMGTWDTNPFAPGVTQHMSTEH